MAFFTGIYSGMYLAGKTWSLSPCIWIISSSGVSLFQWMTFLIAQSKYNLSLTHLALAFVYTRPFVTSNIIGATTMEQLKENIDSVNIEITESMLEDINQVHSSQPNPAP